MNSIIKRTLIKCSIEQLFKFHLDSSNIARITPSNIKVELLNDDPVTYEGKVVKLKITKFFIPQYWHVKIEKLDEPYLLVDVAIRSPFAYWKHQHIFTPKEQGWCELKDIIEYRLPFRFLGQLFNPLIKKDIESMFEFRHQKTKETLEQ